MITQDIEKKKTGKPDKTNVKTHPNESPSLRQLQLTSAVDPSQLFLMRFSLLMRLFFNDNGMRPYVVFKGVFST